MNYNGYVPTRRFGGSDGDKSLGFAGIDMLEEILDLIIGAMNKATTVTDPITLEEFQGGMGPDNIQDNAVTSAAIEDITANDDIVIADPSTALSYFNLLSYVVKQIKALTGETNWYDAVSDSVVTLRTDVDSNTANISTHDSEITAIELKTDMFQKVSNYLRLFTDTFFVRKTGSDVSTIALESDTNGNRIMQITGSQSTNSTIISTYDTTQSDYKSMIMKYDGTLTWGGNNIFHAGTSEPYTTTEQTKVSKITLSGNEVNVTGDYLNVLSSNSSYSGIAVMTPGLEYYYDLWYSTNARGVRFEIYDSDRILANKFFDLWADGTIKWDGNNVFHAGTSDPFDEAPIDGKEYARKDGAWSEVVGGGGSSTLDGLTDVTITTVGTGELLAYTGSGWENQTTSELNLLVDSGVGQRVGTDFTFRGTDGVPTIVDVFFRKYDTNEILVQMYCGQFGSDFAIDVHDVGGAGAMTFNMAYDGTLTWGGNDVFHAGTSEPYSTAEQTKVGYLTVTGSTDLDTMRGLTDLMWNSGYHFRILTDSFTVVDATADAPNLYFEGDSSVNDIAQIIADGVANEFKFNITDATRLIDKWFIMGHDGTLTWDGNNVFHAGTSNPFTDTAKSVTDRITIVNNPGIDYEYHFEGNPHTSIYFDGNTVFETTEPDAFVFNNNTSTIMGLDNTGINVPSTKKIYSSGDLTLDPGSRLHVQSDYIYISNTASGTAGLTVWDETITNPKLDIYYDHTLNFGTISVYNSDGSSYKPLRMFSSGTLTWDGNNIFHAGNSEAYTTAEQTKVGYLTVTSSIDLDTLASNVTTNNAKVSFPEAPNDGNEYVRKNQAWAIATGGGASQLSDLSDVDSTVGSPSDGDIMVYRSAGSDWILEPKPAAGSNPSLNEVTDVTITSVTNDEVLQFTGTVWENQTLAEANIAAADHTHTTLNNNLHVDNYLYVDSTGSYSIVSMRDSSLDEIAEIYAGRTNNNLEFIVYNASLESKSLDIRQDGTFTWDGNNVFHAGTSNPYTTAEQTKVGYLTVTSSKDLDTMATDITSNNSHRTTTTGNPHSLSVDDLTDATITALTDGEVLISNTGTFINQTFAEANIATADHNHTGVYEPADATILKDADIGTNVQAYDSNIVSDASYVHTDNNYTTAEQTKVGYLTVTASTDLDTMRSDVTANNAKVTNATHTGEVTGDTTLTIASNVVDEDNLKLDEAPTNGYVLTADDTKTGGMKWAPSAGGSSDLDGLTDVTITTVATDEILQYTGSQWENQTFTEAGLVGEAPIDGNQYVRKDGAWEQNTGGADNLTSTTLTLGNFQIHYDGTGDKLQFLYIG